MKSGNGREWNPVRGTMMTSAKSPGDYIREALEGKGWTQDDLARVLNRSKSRINEIVLGKQPISPEVAADLAAAFGTPAEIWLEREANYRLAFVKPSEDVSRRAKIFEMAPIKEMQKRGWIKTTTSMDDIEAELLRFFEVDSLDKEPEIVATFRKSTRGDPTPSQKAWCFRVRQMAKALLVDDFRTDNVERCARALQKVAPYSPEARKVPEILRANGIRFIVVEPLAGSRIDGMTTWLDPKSPVIGMSLRFDRIDSFWHTLCHEFSHVRHRDQFSADTDFADPASLGLEVKPEFELRADREAAAMLVNPDELESFIKRVGPFYSKERINQFANKLKIHPGIIVGQLQHRGEIGFSANREMLAKVRHTVTAVAITDGWGTAIDPRTFE